jgi:hypothetical protein
MAAVSPHDWFRPKLTALVAEAAAAGIARDVAVAVITDLINSPPFNNAPVADDEKWNQDIGQPAYEVNPDATISEGEPAAAATPDLGRGLGNFGIHDRGW